MLLGLILLGILSLIIWYIYWKFSHRQSPLDLVPGYKNWPVVGDVLHLPWNSADFLTRLLELVEENRSELVFKLKMFEKTEMFVFSSLEVTTLISDIRTIRKTEALCPLHSYLGSSMLTSTGEDWYTRRETVQPYYDNGILKDQMKTITEHALLLAEKLEKEFCDRPFDIFEPITCSVMDTICSTALGLHTGVLRGKPTRYAKALHVIRKAGDTNPLSPISSLHNLRSFTFSGWRHNQAVLYAHRVEKEVIRKRREMKGDAHYVAGERYLYLDMLLSCLVPDHRRDTWDIWLLYLMGETRKPLTVEQIMEEIDTFILKGIDPISSAIAFTLHLLATHQAAQKRCHDDLDRVVGSEPQVTGSHLRKMVYLDWCISESLRLFPPIPFIGRKLLHEEKFGKYCIPVGTNVNVFTMALHRDPQVFTNPEEFEPTRFDFKSTARRSRHAYIPFSANRRSCFGERYVRLHIKVVIVTLLRRFHIETDQTREQLRIRAVLTLRPGKDGVRVKLTPRQVKSREDNS